MTDIHFTIAHPDAARVLVPLARACQRGGTTFTMFFTGGGTETLADASVEAVAGSARDAVVCHDSWLRLIGDGPCPVRFGSQTNNSELTGRASHVVSL